MMRPGYPDIKSAHRRAVSMGRHHGWSGRFNSHPLAACIDNYTVCIDVELAGRSPDYLSILVWIAAMAKRINDHCAEHQVSGDHAAEYWLERFLWRADAVCVLSVLWSGT